MTRKRRTPTQKARIRLLRSGEPIPEGTPRRYHSAAGYVRLRWRVAPYELVECLEHRFVMGMPPEHLEVHHRNHVRDDNRPENLEVLTPEEHHRRHVLIDEAEVVRLYQSGLSTVEVGRRLGRDHATVYRALVRAGVRPRSISEALRMDLPDDVIRRLHAAGVRSRRIAQVLGVSPTAIDNRVRLLGLTPHRGGRPTDQERECAERAIAEVLGGA